MAGFKFSRSSIVNIRIAIWVSICRQSKREPYTPCWRMYCSLFCVLAKSASAVNKYFGGARIHRVQSILALGSVFTRTPLGFVGASCFAISIGRVALLCCLVAKAGYSAWQVPCICRDRVDDRTNRSRGV